MATEPPRTPNSEDHFNLAVRLESIFMPHLRRLRDAAYGKSAVAGQARFAHYTSAEAALKIIRSKRVWMRNVTCMTDYREVQHGNTILRKFFNRENILAFSTALDSSVPGAAREGFALFDQWWNDIQFSSYIFSVSEHDNTEDSHGRLSMWRAFGGAAARVAMVIRIPWFSQPALALNLTFSPVAYLNEEQVHKELEKVIENIRQNAEFLASVDRSTVVNWVFSFLITGVTCLKHEGFHEEREWRGIYAPKRTPSPLVDHSVEVIGGIPQLVYKLPIDATNQPALQGLDLSSIFDRLIIGPSPYPWSMYEAFREVLTEAKVPSADTRIFVSGIPIRV